MSPEEFLAEHELTKRLKNAGLSDEQLKGVSFKKEAGDEFSIWRVKSQMDWPDNMLSQLRVWCTLRWLILGNPSPSRDKDDALKDLSLYLAAPFYKAGMKHLHHAQKAGKASQAEAEKKAHDFVKTVNELLNKNKKLSKSAALKQVAEMHGIGVSTGWQYFKIVNGLQNSTPHTADLE
jgi:hypothetical protein